MFSNAQAAPLAALVMYCWDMCDKNLHCLSPDPDPRITAAGWNLVGYITGGDKIVKSGDSIRRKMLDVSLQNSDRVCYGYLANNSAGDYVAVIRGTDGAEEWLDDFDFILRQPDAPLQGLVDGGFYGIYQTLQFSHGANTSQPLAVGIAQTVANANVTVLGHSLGAALATYLSAELAALLPTSQITTCLFASPKPGNSEFADYFQNTVLNYQVFNYQRDLVPMAPPLGYSALPGCTILPPNQTGLIIGSSPACCHHAICYIALLDADFYQQLITQPTMTADDKSCAACVISKVVI
ncbi:lipase (class 3) [Serratia fonticola]|jgi:triacylglycerol lipase|uniref:Lipase (Class 3) n=1 Tax=Serratia fonticola TaxID=47917 RepID=A0A559TBF5_SERFO|nr:lipase family protein [Serratia fonticola]TQI80524.1 lipase (class 3) [Serratia fonticola]TQI97451.1 lipase (class 3) [Serratia fonticola]TVZ71948.1 lipase (class 3) [Serratia fonticola]